MNIFKTAEKLLFGKKSRPTTKFEQAKEDYLKSGKMPDFTSDDPIVQDALESGFKAACEE